MESKNFANILDALPKTGVYVIRQDDHSVLYFNRRIAEVSPQAQLGMPCRQLWSSICHNCPLLLLHPEDPESRSICYSKSFGGVVDLAATRTTWENSIPAFLISVTPRLDAIGYTFQKVLFVDLRQDICTVLKSDTADLLFKSSGEHFSDQMRRLAASGILHPSDIERFAAFSDFSRLGDALLSETENLSCIYRRRGSDEDDWHWNLLEIVPGFQHSDTSCTAFFCIKDIDHVLRNGLELEDASIRRREIIRTLAEQHFSVYTLDLDSGSAVPVRVDGKMCESPAFRKLAWETVMIPEIKKRLHEAYHDTFTHSFSLDALRRSYRTGEPKIELLCQWLCGDSYRYVSITAHLDQSDAGYAILAFQDVDERIRRELTHSQRDMQLAAILRSRFSMMNTIDLESGLCERVSLDESADLQSTHMGDYAYYIQQALERFIAPEDVPICQQALSLEHLRKTAAAVEDYHEEIFRYRTRSDPVRWLEQCIIYTRHHQQIMVYILGRDVTKEHTREETNRQMLKDRSDIIISLSRLFFCMYYVDLDSNTFRAVTQLSRTGDVLGSSVDCTDAMRIYANNFVHPDDREAYLRIMNTDNWRENLRWWHPSIEMEYRRLPDLPGGTCTKVRASAVLAGTGSDELPQTVVYVAQDITDSRQF